MIPQCGFFSDRLVVMSIPLESFWRKYLNMRSGYWSAKDLLMSWSLRRNAYLQSFPMRRASSYSSDEMAHEFYRVREAPCDLSNVNLPPMDLLWSVPDLCSAFSTLFSFVGTTNGWLFSTLLPANTLSKQQNKMEEKVWCFPHECHVPLSMDCGVGTCALVSTGLSG